MDNHTQTLSWRFTAVLPFGLFQSGIVLNTSEGQGHCYKASPESLTIMQQALWWDIYTSLWFKEAPGREPSWGHVYADVARMTMTRPETLIQALVADRVWNGKWQSLGSCFWVQVTYRKGLCFVFKVTFINKTKTTLNTLEHRVFALRIEVLDLYPGFTIYLLGGWFGVTNWILWAMVSSLINEDYSNSIILLWALDKALCVSLLLSG